MWYIYLNIKVLFSTKYLCKESQTRDKLLLNNDPKYIRTKEIQRKLINPVNFRTKRIRAVWKIKSFHVKEEKLATHMHKTPPKHANQKPLSQPTNVCFLEPLICWVPKFVCACVCSVRSVKNSPWLTD